MADEETRDTANTSDPAPPAGESATATAAEPANSAPSSPPPPPHYAPPPYQAGYSPEPPRSPNQKSPALAAFLAFFPGMGHIYNGLYQRGVVLFLIFGACIAMVHETGSPIFGFAIAFTWMFNVLDAYRQANLINHGYAADLGMLDAAKPGKPGNGTMIAGLVIFVLGLLQLLEEYNFFDWDVFRRNWPVLLMLGGGWLIWSALKERRQQEELDT